MVNNTYLTRGLPQLLCGLGMVPYDSPAVGEAAQGYPVLLDGTFLGWVTDSIAGNMAAQLRRKKVAGLDGVSHIQCL